MIPPEAKKTKTDTNSAPMRPPRKPSIVFDGLIDDARVLFPIFLPIKYAHVSPVQIKIKQEIVYQCPSGERIGV